MSNSQSFKINPGVHLRYQGLHHVPAHRFEFPAPCNHTDTVLLNNVTGVYDRELEIETLQFHVPSFLLAEEHDPVFANHTMPMTKPRALRSE